MHVNATVAFARDGAGDVVADTESAKSLALAFAQCTQCVGRLTALADCKNERVSAHRRVAMAKLAGVFHFYRNVSELFDEIFANHRSMQCRAASHQHDARDIASFSRGHVQSTELGGAFLGVEPAAHGITN